MSGANTPSGGQAQQPKQMSSRLLTMKFMQRAANSSPSQSTPSRSPYSFNPSPQAQAASDVRSVKRQRTNDATVYALTSNASTPAPSTPNTPSAATDSWEPAERTAITAALKAEADVRAAASLRTYGIRDGSGGVETEWVLNVSVPAPANGANGHAQDEPESESERWASTRKSAGRQTFGSFKRKRTALSANDTTGTPAPPKSRPTSPGGSSDLSSSYDDGEIPEPSQRKPPPSSSAADEARLDRMNLSRMVSLSGNHGSSPSSQNFGGGGAHKPKYKNQHGSGKHEPFSTRSSRKAPKKKKRSA